MFYEWRDALKVARKQTQMIDGQMVHHNRRVKQGCLGQWKKFTLKSRADKHCNKTVTAKVWSSFILFVFCSFFYVENTRLRLVFSTFPSCSQMTVVFYHSVIHGSGFFI